ncbi:MAG: aminotransferase class III-fold pyridoxal phosphate-dependent enzyme [Gammaproteobacteria bacterium]|nr:aminotransferase class III-fold pyridoxal phosphate-dependent enzyme [Gammaproteobacteria bacterium]
MTTHTLPRSTAHPGSTLPESTSPALTALMPITSRPPRAMLRGEGSYLFDTDGRAYLDLVQGWAVNTLGHCPVEIREALAEQSARLINPSPALHNAPQLALAEHLTAASGLAQAHFANSGAEANEAAVKLARKWGQLHRSGAFEIVTTQNAFHGRTLAMMSASGKPGWDRMFPPMPEGFVKVPFGDLEAMAAAIGPRTVALMVEPIQGEAGVITPPDGYLRGLRELADRHGLLLILDEIQTGIGRTGRLFCFEHEQARPDILTLAKGLGGGVPISAMLAAEHACCFAHGDQGGTFNGNPLMAAVALAVLGVVNQPAFLKRVQAAGEQLCAGLAALPGRCGIESVRGRGLLLAAGLARADAEAIRDRAFEAGLVINAPRPDTLRFMPSLRISDAEIDEALAILADVM